MRIAANTLVLAVAACGGAPRASVAVSGCCGTVSSAPAGIACPGGACSATVAAGAVLTAHPAPFAKFVGWTGGCSGALDCPLPNGGVVQAIFGPAATTLPLASAEVDGHGSAFASVTVEAQAPYVAVLFGLTGAASISADDESHYPLPICASGGPDNAAKECRFTAGTGPAFISVAADASVQYVEGLARMPQLSSPAVEGSAAAPMVVVAGTPRESQVGTRGTSYYASTGLDGSHRHVVGIAALSGVADLHVYGDGTYSFELDCTLRRNPSAVPVAQDCSLTSVTSLYFSVTSGAINRDGAAYDVFVR